MATMLRAGGLVAASMVGLAFTTVWAVGPADPPAARAAGTTFTQAQADRGHQTFNNRCAQCHRPDLSGALGPALVGPGFVTKWGTRSVAELMTFEHDNMPANAPGTLAAGDVADITAYILSRNGMGAGASPLSADSARSLRLVDSPTR